MTDLSAASLTACVLLIVVNVWAIVWRRLHLPTDPRRILKFAVVSIQQLSSDQKVVGALIFFLVSLIIWFARMVQ